jgi:hypothetical protein
LERSGKAVRCSALLAVVIRNDSNCLNLQEKVWIRQTGNKQDSDKWWIGTIPPYAPKHLKSGLWWLPMDNVDIPFDDVFQSRSRCRKCDFEVLENLLRLLAYVTFPNDFARRVNRILTTDVDSEYFPLRYNHLRESGVLVQAIWA